MINKHSATWREVAAWAETELAKARERIESVGVDLHETESLRGRIAVLRETLALVDAPEQRVVEQVVGYGFQGPETD